MNRTKRYAFIGVLAALAVVVNLIENWFIPPVGFGIRFGLANIVSLVALKKFGLKEMSLVVLLRLTLGNLLKGTIFGTPFWISASGLLLSSIVIIVLDKLKCSITFTSMMSAFSHTFGQLLAVVMLYEQVNIIVLLPVLVVGSLGTGVLTGLITSQVVRRVNL